MKLRTVTAIVAGMTLGLVPLSVSQSADSEPVQDPYCGPTVIAHRGGTEAYVENTRDAFNHAWENGVRTVETDIQWTSTNTPMIMHDKSVSRTTDGTGSVGSQSYTKLRKYRTSDGQKIPSLWEVLHDGKKYGSKFLLEMKVNPTSRQWQSFEGRLKDLDMHSQVVVISFDKGTLLEAKDRGYTTGWLDGDRGFRYASTIKKYGDYYFKRYQGVTNYRSHYWSRHGIKVTPWTVDSNPTEWGYAKSHPDFGVITNTPVEYLTWAKAQC